MPRSLSIVVPVYEEPVAIRATVAAADAAAVASSFEAEIVLVDDGSGPETREALAALETTTPLRVITLESNHGRYGARAAGLEAATGDWVLFLDARVRLEEDALAWVGDALDREPELVAWNGHCTIETDGNPYARFWDLITTWVFREYSDDPRQVSYGPEEFDRFPKGTGHFLAPRELLREASASFTTHFADARNASDDIQLLRYVVSETPITIAPEFASSYAIRGTLGGFACHAANRGSMFVDSYLRPGTRWFAPLVAFYPVSAALALTALRRPRLGAAGLAGLGLAAGAAARARRAEPESVAAAAVLTPVFAVSFGAGLWRGLGLLIRGRAGDDA